MNFAKKAFHDTDRILILCNDIKNISSEFLLIIDLFTEKINFEIILLLLKKLVF